mgnify:CR=1 FL=1
MDAYARCRAMLDDAIALIRPGVSTAEVAGVWPRAQEFGFADEEAAFALQFGHGVGLSIWEKPIISRLVSLDHPEPIEQGMVFALETFWPASDGWSGAREAADPGAVAAPCRSEIPCGHLLWGVLLIDVLQCPKCPGRMRSLAGVLERVSVRAILVHLGLPADPPQVRMARPPPSPSEWLQHSDATDAA